MTSSQPIQMEARSSDGKYDLYRYTALGAVVGPLLFTLAWVALGALQPMVKTQYGLIGGIRGAITNPISALGVGPNAGLFNFAFVICGLLTTAGVLSLQGILSAEHRAAGKPLGLLLAISPFGLALAGIFTLANSLLMHNVAALLVFVSPLIAFPLSAVRFRRIPRWCRLGRALFFAGPVTLLLLVVFLWTFRLSAVAAGTGMAGLSERLLLADIQGWYVAIGWFAFQPERDDSAVLREFVSWTALGATEHRRCNDASD